NNKVTTTLEGIEEHRQLLEKNFKLIKNRETIDEYVKVKISPDGQIATATRMFVEKINLEDGRQFFTSGTDIFRFAWIDNQPKIISTKTQGWVEEKTIE
ncbi:MAG TPA: hypothetical protein DCF68_18360, partial [Cyanothece sp. UBA12306]|nr:hypothetical protein [Cyanothece sp. UBA12306]